MRLDASSLSIGERVAFHRRRRGMTHATLAALVGRTTSWLEKIENGRAPLDRVSVIRDLADVLGVSIHDLLPDDEPTDRTIRLPELRGLVLSYRAVNPRFAIADLGWKPVELRTLRDMTREIWLAYQDSRFGYVVMRLNEVLPLAYAASREGPDARMASAVLAQLYHVAASVLVKLGDLELARLCADRGDIAADHADDAVTRVSLQRSIAHTLLSSGHHGDAVAVVREGIIDSAGLNDERGISVLGTLMLVGATASARAGERGEAATFLQHAGRLAERLGRDANEMWTSFGPTNVAIHEVTVAAELGDVSRAVAVGVPLDVSQMPRERRIRHELEVARALLQTGRPREALQLLMSAEASAPEHVRRHFLAHQLVDASMRSFRTSPPPDLMAFARRLGHASCL